MTTAADELRRNPARYSDGKGWLPAEQIASLMTTGEEIPNPEPQGVRPVGIYFSDAAACLSPESCQRLAGTSAIVDFVQKVNSGDALGATIWVGFALKAGLIAPQEAAAIAALAERTEPDPTWQATITGPPPLSHVSVAEVESALKEVQL